MRDIFEVLHVSLDEKSAQQCKVRVRRIVHLHKPPRVLPAANAFSLHLRLICNSNRMCVAGSLFNPFSVKNSTHLESMCATDDGERDAFL